MGLGVKSRPVMPVSRDRNGILEATLPKALRCRVTAGTGWSGVNILWQSEISSWTCNFYLSVVACKNLGVDPSLRQTCLLLEHQATKELNRQTSSRAVMSQQIIKQPRNWTDRHQAGQLCPNRLSSNQGTEQTDIKQGSYVPTDYQATKELNRQTSSRAAMSEQIIKQPRNWTDRHQAGQLCPNRLSSNQGTEQTDIKQGSYVPTDYQATKELNKHQAGQLCPSRLQQVTNNHFAG